MSITPHAGAVLLQDFIRRLELPALLDDEICLKERERGYPESEALMALCWNLILGGDSIRDMQVLRGDPGLCELLGVEQIPAPTTTGELLRHFDLRQIHALERVLHEAAQRVRPWQRSTSVTFDLDSSVYVQCSTRKEGSRKAYNGEIGYHPLLCFWAEEGELLYSRLRSGNRHPGGIARWFMERVLRWAPRGKRRYLRADSGFYTWDLIKLCEREEITYAIAADLTQSLRAQIVALKESKWKPLKGSDKGVEVAQLTYAPHPHPPHRYVVKRVRLTDKQGQEYWSYHAVITNDERRSAKKIIKWYYKRCAMENLIKEHKQDFGLEKMPTQKFLANQAWFLLGQLAWNLMAWFKRLCLPEQYHTSTVKTIRHHLLKVAGRIVHQARQRFLILSERYWYRDVWSFALNQLARLRLAAP